MDQSHQVQIYLLHTLGLVTQRVKYPLLTLEPVTQSVKYLLHTYGPVVTPNDK